MVEVVEDAHALLLTRRDDPLALEEARGLLRRAEAVFDLEHVDFLASLLAPDLQKSSPALCAEALRLLALWTKDLQANVPEDGVPMPDSLRDDVIASAVSFLQDEKVKDRSVEEKVQFLREKGVNRTEILVACEIVGVTPPASMQFAEKFRKEMIESGAAFLEMEDLKGKSVEEKLKFLKTKGLTVGEIVRSCEIAELEPMPTAQEIEALNEYEEREAREDMISNGAIFLKHPDMLKRPLRERLKILKSKGLIAVEIEAACARAGISLDPELKAEFATGKQKKELSQSATIQEEPQGHDNVSKAQNDNGEEVRPDMVRKGVTFLNHPKARVLRNAEKLAFLRSKKLTESEIEESCKKSNIPYDDPASLSSSSVDVGQNAGNVQKAIALLKHPSSQGRSLEDKIQFLISKGLSRQEIEEACRTLGLSVPALSTNLTEGRIRRSFTAAETGKNSDLDSAKRIHQGVTFLQNERSTEADAKENVAFLLGKGLSMDEVEIAFVTAGLPWNKTEYEQVEPRNEDAARMESAEKFLRDGKDLQTKARYLREKGFSTAAIEDAFSNLGHNFDREALRKDMILMGKAFVDKAKDDPKSTLDSMKGFLRSKKYLEEEEISQVFEGRETEIQESKKRARINQAVGFLLDNSIKYMPVNARAKFLTEKRGFTEDEIEEALELANLRREPEDPQVLRAVEFLKTAASLSSTNAQKFSYLREKGIEPEAIRRAFDIVGVSLAAPDEADDESVLLKQGIEFLRNPKTRGRSEKELEEYLKGRGLSSDLITTAFKAVGRFDAGNENDDRSEDELVEQAIRFLASEEAQNVTLQQRIDFMRRKGLSDAQIRSAFSRFPKRSGDASGGDPGDLQRQEFIERGFKFLTDPKLNKTPIEEKVVFLQENGLSVEEIRQAALKAKIELVPSYLSTLLPHELRDRSLKVDPDMEPTGRSLQNAMNAAVGILDSTEKLKEDLLIRTLAFLAIALCKSRPVQVSPACVAYVAERITLHLGKVDLCPNLEIDSLLIPFLDAFAELIARSTQLNVYAKDGLDEHKQINLYFLRNSELTRSLIRACKGLPIKACMALARAVHGPLMQVAAFQPMSDTTGPVSEALVDMKEAIAAYALAGMLRGAPDFAWANDVEESPQPKLEKAMHALAREKVSAHVGCACIYADKEISWIDDVASCVLECLLEVLSSPIDRRDEFVIDFSNDFLESELFKLAPQFVQVLIDYVSESEHLKESFGERIHKFSASVFSNIREKEMLCTVVARRSVLALYDANEGEEDLGIHAATVRAMQTMYLCVIILFDSIVRGSSDSGQERWLLAFDTIANLNAFQVRVGETIDLEEWIQLMIKLDGSSSAAYKCFEMLLVPHLDASDKAVLKRGKTGLNFYDWILGARLEQVLNVAEDALLQHLKSCANGEPDADPVASGLVEILFRIAVEHSFKHLNLRAHRWLTETIAIEDGKDITSKNFVPLKFAIVPEYTEEALESHPFATETRDLAFVVGSTLTSLGSTTNEKAQGIALMEIERMIMTVEDRLCGRPEWKKDGEKLTTLLFTSLKAAPLPTMRAALEDVAEMIDRQEDEKRFKLKENLFGAIQKTEDVKRRILLAKWYLTRIEGHTQGGKL